MTWRQGAAVSAAHVAQAWAGVAFDCGCPDVYYCPSSSESECPRHSILGICCGHPDLHVPIPADLRHDRPDCACATEGPDDAHAEDCDNPWLLPSQTLEQLDHGLGTLSLDGTLKGHLASSLGKPLRADRSPHPSFVVVWLDGTKEKPREDWGPDWATVRELQEGVLREYPEPSARVRKRFWGVFPGRSGCDDPVVFDVAWLPRDKAAAAWGELGLSADDFAWR